MTIYFLILLIWLLSITLTLALFKIWKYPSRFREMAINLSLFTHVCLVLAIIIEVSSYLFIIQSDSFSFTLANQRWFQTHWQPINRLGYRDPDYSQEELDTKRLILVVGDSFVAGQGIPNYQHRFSNRLQAQLGNNWLVANVAQVGWSTTEQYQAILNYPYKPALIILSYFIDDIRAAALKSGESFKFKNLASLPSQPVLNWLIGNSHFLNYFYWQWYRYHNQQPEDRYWQYLRQFYATGPAWELHKQELTQLAKYTQQTQIQLLPILFPNLVAIDSSQPILQQITQLFNELQLTPLNLTPLFINHSPATLIVNATDAHPNEQVHQWVADELFKQLATLNIHP